MSYPIEIKNITAQELQDAMAKDWETYHATYETHDKADLAELIAGTDGTLEAALAAAKAHTDFWNEMQSNCYSF